MDANQTTMSTCTAKVGTRMSYGPDYVESCGKPAVITDTHNRPLCLKHYNKWKKKCQKSHNKITQT